MSAGKMPAVLDELPWAYVLNNGTKENHCHYCFAKSTDLIRCPGCRFSRYCNPNCMWKALRIHKEECRMLRAAKDRIPNNKVRLLSRILIKLRNGESQSELHVNISLRDFKQRSYYDLESHEKEIIADAERMKEFGAIQKELQEYMASCTLPATNELFQIYCRMVVNSFQIIGESMVPLGLGIYLALSQLKHSCTPNAEIVYTGIRATLNVFEKAKSEEKRELSALQICYLPLINNRVERRKALKSNYYVNCKCSECAKEEPQGPSEAGTQCPSGCCDDNAVKVVAQDDSECNAYVFFDISELTEMISNVPDFAGLLQGMPTRVSVKAKLEYVYKSAKELLRSLESQLETTDMKLINTETLLAKAAYFKGFHEESLRLHEKVIWRLRQLVPENLELLSLAELAISRLCMKIGDIKSAKQHLLNAYDHTYKCYGRQHNIHNMVLRLLDECEELLKKEEEQSPSGITTQSANDDAGRQSPKDGPEGHSEEKKGDKKPEDEQ